MALNNPASWLIAYDIRCPKRLKRVHKYLSGEAVWVQYSIFVARTTAQKLGCLRVELAGMIDADVDDVRIYRVPECPAIVSLGVQGFPDGIMIFGDPTNGATLPFTSRKQPPKLPLVDPMREPR